MTTPKTLTTKRTELNCSELRHPEYWINKNLALREQSFEAINKHEMDIQSIENLANAHALIFRTMLPPFRIGQQFFKGIAYSNNIDLLVEAIPDLSTLFFMIADSEGMGLPTSKKADAIFSHYPNPERQKVYEIAYSGTTAPKWIPFQSADWVNAHFFRPLSKAHESQEVFHKTIDLLCLDQAYPASNLPIIAEGLNAFRIKYPDQPIQLHWYFNGPSELETPQHDTEFQQIYRQLEAVLISPQDFIVFHPEQPDATQRLHLYNQTRIMTSAMVFGPKHPYLYEAACCNTPLFWLSGYHPTLLAANESPFPEGCGASSIHHPDSWAEGLFNLLNQINQTVSPMQTISPRLSLLSLSGRKQVLKTCLNTFDLYQKRLPQLFGDDPDFFQSHFAHEHILMDMAILDAYQMDLNTWLQQDHAGSFYFVQKHLGSEKALTETQTLEALHPIQEQIIRLKKQFRKWL